MQNYILLRMCKIFWDKDDIIRLLLGMCEEHYQIKNHHFFIKSRPRNIHKALRPNESWGCYLTSCLDSDSHSVLVPEWCRQHQRCVFTVKGDSSCTRTFFLDGEIKGTRGIFQWIIRITYGLGGDTVFHLGSAPSDRLSYFDVHFVGSIARSSSMSFSQTSSGGVPNDRTRPALHTSQSQTSLEGITAEYGLLHHPRGDSVPDGALVAVEIDVAACTLSFFVNAKKQPFKISRVCMPLYLGVSRCGHATGSAFTPVAFRRLPACTPSALACPLFEMKQQ